MSDKMLLLFDGKKTGYESDISSLPYPLITFDNHKVFNGIFTNKIVEYNNLKLVNTPIKLYSSQRLMSSSPLRDKVTIEPAAGSKVSPTLNALVH